MSTLRVYIDFKSPAAYLALKPTLALAQRTGTILDWQPIRTRQSAVPVAPDPEQKDQEDKGTRHRRVRAQARRDTHLFYAKVQGIPMRFPAAEFPATDLALAALAAVTDSDAFVEAAFHAYWADAADLNTPATVEQLLSACGTETGGLASLPVADLLAQKAEQAIADQVIDAPGYVIGEQVFIGREHLPWIEELLCIESSTPS